MGLHESGVGHKVCCWDGQERGDSEIKLQDDGGCDQFRSSTGTGLPSREESPT